MLDIFKQQLYTSFIVALYYHSESYLNLRGPCVKRVNQNDSAIDFPARLPLEP